MDHVEEILVVRADREVKEELRRFQGQLQMNLGRRVTMREALKVALSSAQAAYPVRVKADMAEIAARLDLANVETSRAPSRRQRKPKEKADAAA